MSSREWRAWRADDLPGASTASGRTYDGGTWSGGGPVPKRHLSVRLYAPMGQPASVEVDMGDKSHGCTVSLTPELARSFAAAVLERAEAAEAEIAKWRDIVRRQREEIGALALRYAKARAGDTTEDA